VALRVANPTYQSSNLVNIVRFLRRGIVFFRCRIIGQTPRAVRERPLRAERNDSRILHPIDLQKAEYMTA
ncbi:MAG TPA: hypothetical protein PLI31_09155, partial [Methanoregulaceae archaeon]|nr:hypothetical protein [Methanoregulaceae archaeon]